MIKRLIYVLMEVLLIVATNPTNQIQEETTPIYEETQTQEDSYGLEETTPIHKESQTQKDSYELERTNPIVKVSNENYAEAYAEALVKGYYCPSSKANDIFEKYAFVIEEEPRFVEDDYGELHLIWTNGERYMVVDGERKETKVSECIWRNQYPKLPEDLEKLKKEYEKNEGTGYGIAETTYLEDLMTTLNEKGIQTEGLWRVRFYRGDGYIVPVYSLSKNGELYIGTKKAKEVLH